MQTKDYKAIKSAIRIIFILVLIFVSSKYTLHAQSKADENIVYLSLSDALNIAADSSLSAFIAENMYYADYWEYRNYQAQSLPFLNFSTVPLEYVRSMSQEYNFVDSTYQYIEKQIITSSTRLSLEQNITKTGGKVFIDSDIGRLDNKNSNLPTQYNVTAIRLGVEQELFGFNKYKWEAKIEPLKFEKAKKELVESVEHINNITVAYFFNAVRSTILFEIEKNNLANSDTLYQIGLKRYKIASIFYEDLQTLKLNNINASINLDKAKIELKRAKLELSSLLRLDNIDNIELVIPHKIPSLKIDPLSCLRLARDNNPELLDYRQQLLESAMYVDKAKKESRFNSSISASVGLNQTGISISEAYTNMLDQELFRFSLNIPIVDWGLAKGRHNLAQKNYEALEYQIIQDEIDFERNIILTAEEFNLQSKLVAGAAMADTVANLVYAITKKRFMLGKVDVIKLDIVQQSSNSARLEYINALNKFWSNYFMIRRITLFDFENNKNLIQGFDDFFNIKH